MNNAKEIVEAGGKAFIKELVSYLPLGGTAVAIYDELQNRQVERKIRRLEEFYTSLTDSVKSVKDKINREYVGKDDFLDVFEEATRYVVLERQAEKRLLFKNILANSITFSDGDYDKTERYFRLLDNLGELELRVLAVLENPIYYNQTHGMIIQYPNQSSWNMVTALGVLTQLLGLKYNEVEEAITILFSNGLVVENALGKQLQTNGNTIHVLENLLTIRGRDFVKYLNG